jgi:ankyrin repeat protein
MIHYGGSEPEDSSLVEAVMAGNLDMVKGIIARGADVRFGDNAALGVAIESSIADEDVYYEIVKLLLEKGAPIKNKKGDPYQNLYTIMYYDNLELFKLFEEHGLKMSGELRELIGESDNMPNIYNYVIMESDVSHGGRKQKSQSKKSQSKKSQSKKSQSKKSQSKKSQSKKSQSKKSQY